MRLIFIPILGLLFFITYFSFGQTPFSGNKFESNTIFVKIKDASSERIVYPNSNKEIGLNTDLKKIIDTYKISSIAAAFHTTEKTDARLKRVHTVSFPNATQREAIMSALRNLSFIDYVEAIPIYEMFLTPNDLNPQQWNLPKINAAGAWDLSTGSNKVIAIVDDAVRLTHEDLAANIWNNPLEIAGNGIDDDGNGYVDDVHGYDVADDDSDPMVPVTATNSEFTHGTHCSGIAAGVSNNGKGIASIGYNNKIMAVKCKESADLGGSLPFAYSGLIYAIETHADVISMSWGGYYYSATYQLLFDVAYDAGIICVAAAGNSNTDIPMYPASYDHVISVGATDQNDLRASFSNYGNTVDVSAPGVDIYSTLAGSDNAYGMLSGTSMACPLVSGLCALMLSYDPTLTPDELERCLKDNADNIDNANPAFLGKLGAGRINAYQTMLCLQTTPTAEFRSDKQLVCPGQLVSYTDMSALGSNTGVTWSWSFPGGVPSTSSLQNPTVVYNVAGTYSATLTVTNTFGNNVLTKTNYITVNALTAVLSGTASIPTGGNALLKVDFSNSTGPYSIVYSDGITSVTKNNITTNPYYFTVTPAATSTYTLTSVTNAFCTGTYSGNAVISMKDFASTNCSGTSSIMFERAYGNSTNDYGTNVIQSNTGENYLIGMHDVGNSTANFTISKLDASWNIVWTKAIGTNKAEFLYTSIKSMDENIMLCGSSSVNGALDVYVAKIDFSGNIIWANTYGGANDEYGFGISNTADGGYVIAGRAESYASGISAIDSYIVKIDGNGTMQWSKAFGKQGNDYAFSCVQTSDGGYITGSGSQRTGNTNYDCFITKLDASGNISWSKYYGSSDDEGPRRTIVTSDGGILIGGTSRYRSSTPDAMVTKLDASGNLLWSKVFGGNGADDVFALSESSDGDYLVAGITDSYGAGGYDVFFSKMDVNGNILWSKIYGGTQHDNFPSFGVVKNSTDGGFLLVATTASFGAGGADMYVIKTDCNGNTTCSSKDVMLQNYPTAVTLVNVTPVIQNAPGNSTPVSSSTTISFSAKSFCVAPACTINADFFASDTTICKGTTINFTNTSTNATGYKWYINNVLVGQSTALSRIFTTEGDYKVILVAENSSCSDSDTLTIHVVGFPQLLVTDDMTICRGTSANLLVSGATKYQWLNSSGISCTTCSNPIATPTSSQYFVVKGTDVNGCVSQDSVKIIVSCCVNGVFSPKGSFSFSDTTVCVNDIVAITNLSFTSNISVQAQWNFGTSAVPQFSSAIQPGNVKFTQPGRWPITLIIIDDCGRDSIVNYINVFNPPVVEPYPDVFLCSPLNRVQFDITPISDYSYRWVPTFGLSDSLVANPWVDLVDTSIVYRRTIKDNNTGCETADIVKVSSHTSFQIQAMNDTTIVAGQEVTLKACCGSYTWSPSTYLNNGNSQNPIATPYASIWYYVQAIDTIGCVARDSVFIRVAVLDPFIPNLVTPNGDNLNDTFEIRNLCPGSRVEIYNRWGDLVFKSENYKNEWNGKNDSDGMYYVTFQSGCGGKVYKSWLQVLGGN